MLYATDLDRTVIFSNKFLDNCDEEVICVETNNGKPISYMTASSLDKLNILKENKKLNIVPVTTRSISQFKRVEPFQDCEFAITSNGGTILHNGKPFLPWVNYIQRVLSNYTNELKEIPMRLKGYSDYFQTDLTFVDGVFFYCKLKDYKEKNDYLLMLLESELDSKKWNFILQGLKLYIIPKEISKENTVLNIK